MRTTIATALAAIIASLMLAAGPASAADKPATARTLRVEATPAPTGDPALAEQIKRERARLQTLRAQRQAERAAARQDKAAARAQQQQATLARLRQQIAALESRSAGGK